MFSKEGIRTLVVALVLCLVCSVLVAGFAVGLKPQQQHNQTLDRNQNILAAAGMYDAQKDTPATVVEKFEAFDMQLVDLATGKYATPEQLSQAGINPKTYDAKAAGRNAKLSIDLEQDPAGIGRQVKYAPVYLLGDSENPEAIVLPIHGYGLWGTVYGFIVLESDLNTIRGITFYDQKETPGLGARITEEAWQAKWHDKKVYDEQGKVIIGVTKGASQNPNKVDGISGATLTGRGVNNLVQFWLGEQGYKHYLDNLKQGAA